MPVTQSSEVPDAELLSQDMSQVILRTIEITNLMKQNWDLMEMADVREDLKKKVEEHCRELESKNSELSKLVSCQEALIGVNHLIWDTIIVEAHKVWPYLDFIQDKEDSVHAAKKHIQTTKLDLHKRRFDTAEGAINFLNNLTDEEIR